MVMVTIDIPPEINKRIEHYKIENDIKDKREAINRLLRESVLDYGIVKKKPGTGPYDALFIEADNTPKHNLTPRQIERMDSDIYE